MLVKVVDEVVRIPIGTIEIVSVQKTASVAIVVDGGDDVNVVDMVMFE